MMMLGTIVDWTALGRILIAALVVGVGVTALFGQGALAWERLEQGRGSLVRDGAIIAFVTAVSLAALALGIVAMTDKIAQRGTVVWSLSARVAGGGATDVGACAPGGGTTAAPTSVDC